MKNRPVRSRSSEIVSPHRNEQQQQQQQQQPAQRVRDCVKLLHSYVMPNVHNQGCNCLLLQLFIIIND
jgi:hypothetical protein